MSSSSTVLDVMRAIAACGLRRGDVTEVLVERDRDRHFTVEVETLVRDGLIDEVRKKIAGAELDLKQMRIKRMAGSIRFDVRLRERFSPWPITEVNDLFLRAFRINPHTRVDNATEGQRGQDPVPMLQAIEFIRLRPASYIGSVKSALPLFERAFEAYVERAAVEGSRVEISLGADGQVTLSDDAPGVSLIADDGADREINRFLGGGGVVKALSSAYREESRHGEVVQVLEYVHGRRIEKPRASLLERDGNRVVFTPDFDILDASCDPKEVRQAVEWQAMLAPRSRVQLNGEELSFASFGPAVRRLAQGPLWEDKVFEFSFDDELVHIDCALGFRDGQREVQWFVNRQRVGGAGSLEHGLRAAVRNAISLGRPELEVREPLEHVVGVVMARVPDLNAGNRGQYEDPAVDAVLERELTPALSVFFDGLPGARERLISSSDAEELSPHPAHARHPPSKGEGSSLALAATPQEQQRERQQRRGAERGTAGRRRRT